MDDSKLLGPVIKAWFKANEWPQSVSEGLARAKGWEIGPWASQISICMSGRLQPKPPFFVALGMFNQAIAERDFVGVTDRRLMDRLRAGEPIVHDDCCTGWRCQAGTPWDAMDFFGCYIGAIKPPKKIEQSEPLPTSEETEEAWSVVTESFRELVLAAMDPGGPKAVWAKLAKAAIEKGMAVEDVEYVQEVIAGLRQPTPQELQRLRNKYPVCPVLESLCEKGGSANLEELIRLSNS